MFLLLFIFLRLVTEREKQLISSRRYNTLVQEQKVIDAEVDLKVGDIGM